MNKLILTPTKGFLMASALLFSSWSTALATDTADMTLIHKGEFTMGSKDHSDDCLLYTSPSPRDRTRSRMPSSA